MCSSPPPFYGDNAGHACADQPHGAFAGLVDRHRAIASDLMSRIGGGKALEWIGIFISPHDDAVRSAARARISSLTIARKLRAAR
jgi:hypothetical protein